MSITHLTINPKDSLISNLNKKYVIFEVMLACFLPGTATLYNELLRTKHPYTSNLNFPCCIIWYVILLYKTITYIKLAQPILQDVGFFERKNKMKFMNQIRTRTLQIACKKQDSYLQPSLAKYLSCTFKQRKKG